MKGIVLRLFFRHLFTSTSKTDIYYDIMNCGLPLVFKLEMFCKLCVTIFVFISEYGFAASISSEYKIKNLYIRKRLRVILESLGKHRMNIYHTCIFFYLFIIFLVETH